MCSEQLKKKKKKKVIGKYADVFTPVGVTGGLHLRYNDPMTKTFICIHVQNIFCCTQTKRKKCKSLIL